MVRAEDEKELARKFDHEHVDTKSASAMFELLRRKLSHSPAYPHMLSLFQHMLLLPCKFKYFPSPFKFLLISFLSIFRYWPLHPALVVV